MVSPSAYPLVQVGERNSDCFYLLHTAQSNRILELALCGRLLLLSVVAVFVGIVLSLWLGSDKVHPLD